MVAFLFWHPLSFYIRKYFYQAQLAISFSLMLSIHVFLYAGVYCDFVPGFLKIPNVVEELSLPTLFLAVQVYNPVSSTEKSRMLKEPLLTVLLPFGKAAKERVHAMLAGG